jgi:membrane-associated protease RseP (regulator of RpoE activity)
MKSTRVWILSAIFLPLLAISAAASNKPGTAPVERIPYYVPHLLDSVEDAAGKLHFLQPNISSLSGTSHHVPVQQLSIYQYGVNFLFSEHGMDQETQYFWSWDGGYNAPIVTPYENNWSFSIKYASVRFMRAFPRRLLVVFCDYQGSGRMEIGADQIKSFEDITEQYRMLSTGNLDSMHMFLDAFATLTVASGNANFIVVDFDYAHVDDKTSQRLKLDRKAIRVVTQVQAGGPADKAGLQEGDVIVSADGKSMRDYYKTLSEGVQASPGGYTMHLSLLRNGVPLEKEVTYAPLWPAEAVQALQARSAALAKSNAAAASGADATSTSASGGVKLGVRVHNITAEEARSAGLNEVRGVLVEEVAASGIAADAKVQPGDVILEIDGAAIGSREEMKAILQKGAPSRIKVWRKGAALFLTVRQNM